MRKYSPTLVWRVTLLLYLYRGGDATANVFERLVGGSEVVFSCNNTGVTWRRNGISLPNDQRSKYELFGRDLTINTIHSTDEGNYTCEVDGNVYFAGSLLVYGTASLGNQHIDLDVSLNATIAFNLTLTFSEAGPLMYNQEVYSYCIKRSKSEPHCLVSCNGKGSYCNTNGDNRWRIEDGPMLILEEAEFNDTKDYYVLVRVVDPIDQIRDIDQFVYVRGHTCGDYPTISDSVVQARPAPHINGASVTYSCTSGCILRGGKSLRCWIRLERNQNVNTWVNENGHESYPSCLCPSTGVEATLEIDTPKPSEVTRQGVEATLEIDTPKPSEVTRLEVSSYEGEGVLPTNADNNPVSDKYFIVVVIALPAALLILVVITIVAIFSLLFIKRRSNAVKPADKDCERPPVNYSERCHGLNTSECCENGCSLAEHRDYDAYSINENVELKGTGNSRTVVHI